MGIALEVDGSITITPVFEKEKVGAPSLTSTDTPTSNHPTPDKMSEVTVIE